MDGAKQEVLSIANEIAAKANEARMNYALILPGCGGNDFDVMLSTVGKPGYMNFFQKADADSSQIMVFPFSRYPKILRGDYGY